MKSLEEFKNYYKTDILPDVQELELIRLKIFDDIKNFKIKLLLTGAGILPVMLLIKAYIYPSLLITTLLAFYFFIIICMCGIPYIYKEMRMHESGFLDGFKQKVIKKMLTFYNESFSYSPGEHISLEDFKKASLFPDIWQANRIYGDDMVRGKIGDVNITFSEIHVSHHSSGKNSHTREIFNGLFFKGEFKKSFRPTESGIVSRRNVTCKIESDEGFTFNIEKEIYQVCCGSTMYIAIPAGQLFEPAINRSLLCFDEIAEYMEYLLFVTGTFQELSREKGMIETTAESTSCPSCGLSNGHSEFCTKK